MSDSSSASASWYTRIDGELFGPVQLTTLQHWASKGSLHGGCDVGTSSEGPWQSAAGIPALQMEWQIIPPNGDEYELCHILSLRAEMENGDMGADWEVLHVPSGERFPAAQALCSALIAQNHILEKQLVQNFARIRELETPGHDQATTELAETSEPSQHWGEHMKERDQFARDAAKWKRLYEEAQETLQSRETAWESEKEDLKAWGRQSAERIRSLERRRNQLEEMQTLVGERAASGGDPDLRQAYQELRLQLDHLMESLDLRNRQLESIQIRLSETEEELALERSRRTEEREREKILREEAVAQLSRMEEAHRDLTRSYRDLNERMIRLRNQMEASGPALRTTSPGEPGILSAKIEAKPLPPPDGQSNPPPAGKVKIKLT